MLEARECEWQRKENWWWSRVQGVRLGGGLVGCRHWRHRGSKACGGNTRPRTKWGGAGCVREARLGRTGVADLSSGRSWKEGARQGEVGS